MPVSGLRSLPTRPKTARDRANISQGLSDQRELRELTVQPCCYTHDLGTPVLPADWRSLPPPTR